MLRFRKIGEAALKIVHDVLQLAKLPEVGSRLPNSGQSGYGIVLRAWIVQGDENSRGRRENFCFLAEAFPHADEIVLKTRGRASAVQI